MSVPDFLHHHGEFTALLKTVADNRSIPPDLIEKDYWIMHCLYGLKAQGYIFELKGGTSLSKGFQIISRFSEDIDLRIHPPRDSGVATNPKQTKSKHSASRKEFYEQLAKDITINGIDTVTRDTSFDDAQHYRSGGIRLNYQEAFPVAPGVKQGVLLEVGFDVVTPYHHKTISSWSLDFARQNNLDIIDNRALDIPCYHPGYTFVEKLQTIATKYRRQQKTGELPQNFMRHYYDLVCLLDNEDVKSFIGTEDYHAHKEGRFPKEDAKIPLYKNEAFLLSDPSTRALYQKSYEATASLYYEQQPSFESVLASIRDVLDTL